MSYCLNPNCRKPQNPDHHKFCMNCGQKLLLKERYFAVKPIGQGGFGKTFLGVDNDKPSKPSCVIKQFLPSSQGTHSLFKATELFNQEAMRLEELGKHSQIPELYGHFEQDNYLYLIQEYIEGKTLEDLLKNGNFEEKQIRELLINLLPVLQFIHDHHVIHRDIKPENIIQRRRDQAFVLVDFGAAKHTLGTALSTTGTIIGDPRYMSPEQLLGKADKTSDLYCLGVTCLYLLTGIDPLQLFDNSEDQWVWKDYLTTSVSDDLANILERMIFKATKRRFPSSKDILEALNSDPKTRNFSPPVTPSKILLPARSDNKKWGYIDERGIFIIPPQFDKAKEFYNGRARVKLKDKWGMIDKNGHIVIPIEFAQLEEFSEGLAKVNQRSWGWDLVNKLIQGSGGWGFIDTTGKLVIPFQYSEVSSFQNGLAKVKKNEKWGMIDLGGNVIIPCEFYEIGDFYEDLVRVTILDKDKDQFKYGFCNREGKIVIPCHFDEANNFHGGRAKVKQRRWWGMKKGYIDSKGNWIK